MRKARLSPSFATTTTTTSTLSIVSHLYVIHRHNWLFGLQHSTY